MTIDQWFLLLASVFIGTGLLLLRKEKTGLLGLAFCLIGSVLCVSIVVLTIAAHWD